MSLLISVKKSDVFPLPCCSTQKQHFAFCIPPKRTKGTWRFRMTRKVRGVSHSGWCWFRANLLSSSETRFHQISLSAIFIQSSLSCSTVRRTTCTHGVGCKGMIHYRCYLPVYQISPLLPLVCFLRPNTCMPALGCDCHTVEHERLNLHPTNSFCV